MNKKIIDYKVVRSDTAIINSGSVGDYGIDIIEVCSDTLNDSILHLIDKGYQPYGDLKIVQAIVKSETFRLEYYVQAMVKYEE